MVDTESSTYSGLSLTLAILGILTITWVASLLIWVLITVLNAGG